MAQYIREMGLTIIINMLCQKVNIFRYFNVACLPAVPLEGPIWRAFVFCIFIGTICVQWDSLNVPEWYWKIKPNPQQWQRVNCMVNHGISSRSMIVLFASQSIRKSVHHHNKYIKYDMEIQRMPLFHDLSLNNDKWLTWTSAFDQLILKHPNKIHASTTAFSTLVYTLLCAFLKM